MAAGLGLIVKLARKRHPLLQRAQRGRQCAAQILIKRQAHHFGYVGVADVTEHLLFVEFPHDAAAIRATEHRTADRIHLIQSLTFEWKEVDGPAVQQPGAQGFGSTLIDTAIPGAQVKREFQPDGFVCRIEVPLPESS